MSVPTILAAGFLFLGGLLLYPLVRLDEVLAPVSILLCLLEEPVCSFLISPLSGGCYSKSPI